MCHKTERRKGFASSNGQRVDISIVLLNASGAAAAAAQLGFAAGTDTTTLLQQLITCQPPTTTSSLFALLPPYYSAYTHSHSSQHEPRQYRCYCNHSRTLSSYQLHRMTQADLHTLFSYQLHWMTLTDRLSHRSEPVPQEQLWSIVGHTRTFGQLGFATPAEKTSLFGIG